MYYQIEYQIFHKPKKEFILAASVTKFLDNISSEKLEELKKKILVSTSTSFDLEVQIVSITPLDKDNYQIEYQIFHKPKKEFILAASVTKFVNNFSSEDLEELKKKILTSTSTSFDLEVQIVSITKLEEY